MTAAAKCVVIAPSNSVNSISDSRPGHTTLWFSSDLWLKSYLQPATLLYVVHWLGTWDSFSAFTHGPLDLSKLEA